MTASQDYVDALVAALEAQGIPLEQYYAELGHGQQEISTAHRPALQAADEQLLVRETIRGVAAAHGLVASLAPKPWPDVAGNGGHVHFSLWDARRAQPLLRPRGAGRLLGRGRARSSPACSSTCPGLCGLTAPSFNSYQPDRAAATGRARSRAGATTTARRRCGCRRRSAGMEEASTNVELKAADATCNPYLALGGLIAAGLDGLERGLEPPEPVDVDPATLPEDERARAGIRRCPRRRPRRSTRSRPTPC